MSDATTTDRQFATAFTHATIGMSIVSLDGRFWQVNEALCRILARSEEDLRGRSILEVTDPRDYALGAEDLRRLVAGEIDSVMHEKRYISGTGDTVVVRLSGAVVRDDDGRALHFVSQMEDVTEARRTSARLEASEARFRWIFDKSPVAMCLVHRSGALQAANRSFAELVGLSPSQLVERPLTDLLDGLSHSDLDWSHSVEPTVIGEHPVAGSSPQRWVLVVATCLDPVGDQDPELIVQLLDLTAQRDEVRSLRHQAFHDDLTGLPNRQLLARRLDAALEDRRAEGAGVGLVMVDLDHFKRVNDTLGHLAGDEVLVEAARRMRDAVRAGDTVARLGGDEFVVVLRGVHDWQSATDIAAKVRQRLAEPYQVDGQFVTVGASLGVSFASEAAADARSLLRDADAALYQAKRARTG